MAATVLGTDLAAALGTPIDWSDADNWPIAEEPPPVEPGGLMVEDDSGNQVVDDSGNDVEN